DGKHIAYFAVTEGHPQIYIVNSTGGNPEQVTDEQTAKHGLRWAPDGEQLAFISNREKYQDIYIVPAAAKQPARKLTEQTNEWDELRWAPAWSADSKTIAFVSGRSNYYDDELWMIGADGTHLEKVTTGIRLMGDPIWSPDGKRIAFNAVRDDEYWFEDMSDLFVFDVSTHALHQILTEAYVSDFEMSAHVFWSPDSTVLYYRNISRGDTNIWGVLADGSHTATPITYGIGTMPSLDLAKNGTVAAFVRTSPLSPGELFTIPAIGGEPKQLTHWATDFEGVKAPAQVSFKAHDGLYIHGYLYQPASMQAGGKYAGLVSVHGGGTNAYGNGFHGLEQYMASKGYTVLAIEYRGSSGYGRPFQLLSVGEWTQGQGWDAVAASEYLRSLSDSNGKVGIYGGSYGGIMTMAAVARDSSKFQAAAPFYGIYDWAEAYGDADRLGKIFLVTGFNNYTPLENPELYARNSTVSYLDQITTPLLIEHGELDRRAPYSQALRITDALKKAQKTFEFFHYPNEMHGIHDPKNYVDAYTRMEKWFDHYLR
ncbi:MAG TPA: prolyl oligopeptidase family serine peptidase, partial [Edaphobacter sp.]|nr:prolyl oligopeptidase family serine peptidase [Edaphobacter sp.]